jgi:L-malate glycosyltransferase
MTRRPRLHYHSDCDFFAGCENMLANFFNDDRVRDTYDVTFSYRWSARYEAGLRARVPQGVHGERYALLAGTVLTRHVTKMPRALGLAVRALNYVLLLRYWILLWNVLVLARAWRGRGIDIVHINNGGYPAALSCLSAAIAARLCGVPHVVMVVNNIAQGRQRYRYWWLDRPLDTLVGRCVSRFVTGSANAGRALQSVLRLPESAFTTLHNGIAPRPPTESREQSRTRLGVDQQRLVFGMVALLEWRKGHRVLLQAVAALRAQLALTDMPLFLIEGDGPDRKELAEMVAQLDIGDLVRFVGVEQQVFNFMQALDVMLLPSVANEDFPNVILEGMSLGKPVIASRLAGTPEQVDDGVTGALVEPNNPIALARRIAEFAADRDALAEMGRQARTQFDQRFTAGVAVSRYLNLYQTLLSGD